MSDTPMDDARGAEQARSALERAHRAAIAMDGGELRRALEEARDALPGDETAGSTRSLVIKALGELDDGPLDEMERLVEQARAALTSP
jgi:cellobiose-specific phosphotransferase system component IIA